MIENVGCKIVFTNFLGVIALLQDLHNSFSEPGIKTAQTVHKNKQHYQCVRNSFLVNFPPRVQKQSRLKDRPLLTQVFWLPLKIFKHGDRLHC